MAEMGGFEPPSTGRKPAMLGHYTTSPLFAYSMSNASTIVIQKVIMNNPNIIVSNNIISLPPLIVSLLSIVEKRLYLRLEI